MNTPPEKKDSMLAELDAMRKDLEAQPDSPESQDMLFALAQLQNDLATSRRLDLAIKSHEDAEAVKLKRGGISSLALGVVAVLAAVAAAIVQPTIQVLLYSTAGAAIGAVMILAGVFAMKKRRIARNIFSRRDWAATSFLEALRLRSPPRSVTPPPQWRNKLADRRIVTRAADYEPRIQSLINELIVLIPDAWGAGKAIFDCDAISIHSRISKDGDASARLEPSPSLLHFGADLYAQMGKAGDRWSECSVLCRKTNRAWSYEIKFNYVGPFPTPGYLVPRSMSDAEFEETITYFEERGRK
jgi:hypothetical protein